jgi:DNA repair protein RadD
MLSSDAARAAQPRDAEGDPLNSLLVGNSDSNTENSSAQQAGDLRHYQVEAARQTYKEIRLGHRCVVLQLPTGAGKTKIAGQIIKHGLANGRRIAFLVPYVTLVDQTVEALGRDGILDIGVVQANHPLWRPRAHVQICTPQTLERRNMRPDVDLVIIDECHRRNGYVIKWMAEANIPFIGLSATPWASGMGKDWGALVRPVTMAELMRDGFLVTFRVFAPTTPDLSKVHVRKGDYVEGELSEVMSDPMLVADVVTTWCTHAEGRPTVVFAVDCAHAHVLRSQFQNAGIPTGYIDAKTSRLDRNDLARRLADGDIKVLVNIDVLTAGFDCPAVSCIVLARPTRSKIRYVQAVGRGLRPDRGKTDCLILDHSDTTATLGFVDTVADAEFRLDDGRTGRGAFSAKDKSEPLPKKCSSCSFLKPPLVATCPECGFTPESRRDIKCIDGDLVELTSVKNRAKQGAKFSLLSDEELFGQLKYHADSREFKPGWAANKFKVLRDRWPPRYIDPDLVTSPSMELASWIKSEAIRFAKAQGGRRHAS